METAANASVSPLKPPFQVNSRGTFFYRLRCVNSDQQKRSRTFLCSRITFCFLFFRTFSDIDKEKNRPIPEFPNLVNYPANVSSSKNNASGMKPCVMCGKQCQISNGKKSRASSGTDRRTGNSAIGPLIHHNGNTSNGSAVQPIIPSQNKGLCTSCDVNVWVVNNGSNIQIKWCKGCKNFRTWASFGEKGLATKCLRCRERQREKYAMQKEEKERARSMIVSTGSAVAVE